MEYKLQPPVVLIFANIMKKPFFNIFFLKTSNNLFYPFFLGIVLVVFLLMAYFNFISHSEFWAIASAKLLGSTSHIATVVYYKSLFYGLLKSLYLVPLNNTNHILWARLLFGFIGWLNFWLILTNIKWIYDSKKMVYLYAFFLLSFQIYFYNSFRVRADILTQLMSLSFYTLINYQYLNNKQFKVFDVLLVLLSLLTFLTSPKSVYPLACLLIYRSFLFHKRVGIYKNLKSMGLIVMAPIGLLLIFFYFLDSAFVLAENPYALALNYHLTSSKKLFTYDQWIHLIISFKLNPLHYLTIFLGLYYFFKNKYFTKPMHFAQLALCLCALMCILIHSEKWPYFIASLTPWLFLPALYFLQEIKSDFKKMIPYLLSLIVFPLAIGPTTNWFHSNRAQLQVIHKLEELVQAVPDRSYFDSTGLLPRENAHMWFLGPNDPSSKSFAIRSFREIKPDFIFLTPKVRLAFPELIVVLSENYQSINDSVYLYNGTRHLFNPKALQENFQLELIFNYDYIPQTNY